MMYNKRSDIINAFINEDIYPGDVEKGVYYESEEPEPKFEKSIAERTKIRKQKGQELKILTPNQMLRKLPITLAQLKAGNNPEKLKK